MKIVFFGDSVTEGCFELIKAKDGNIEIVRDKGYVSILEERLGEGFQVINAGISGNTSEDGLRRIGKDVLEQSPDMAVVCFGLNDACLRKPEQYYQNMSQIFARLCQADIKTIFMTPNMMNTYVHKKTLPELLNTAEDCAACQTSGEMDILIEKGILAAQENDAAICDVYSRWKKLAQYGIDTTSLLCNYINHPTRKMHLLFADALWDEIISSYRSSADESL